MRIRIVIILILAFTVAPMAVIAGQTASTRLSDIDDYPEFMKIGEGVKLPIVGEVNDKVLIKIGRNIIMMAKAPRTGGGIGINKECPLAEAQQKIREKDLKGACQLYEACLKLTGENAQVLQAVGLLKMAQAQAGDAVKALEEAVAVDPFDDNIIENYGDALCLSGETDKGLEQYQKATAINPIAGERIRQKIEVISRSNRNEIARYLIAFNGFAFKDALPASLVYTEYGKNRVPLAQEEFLYKDTDSVGPIGYVDWAKYLDSSKSYAAYRDYQAKKIKEFLDKTEPLEARALKEIKEPPEGKAVQTDWNAVAEEIVRGQAGLLGAMDQVRIDMRSGLKDIVARIAKEDGYRAIVAISIVGARDITKKAARLHREEEPKADLKLLDRLASECEARVILRKKIDMEAFFAIPVNVKVK